MSSPLTDIFLPPALGQNVEDTTGAICTAWDPVTFHSTIVIGGVVTITNAPILSSALATMGTGLVAMTRTAAGFLCLGRLTVPT